MILLKILIINLIFIKLSLSKKTTTPTTKEANPNCALIVPDYPLTAEGLMTPYIMFSQDKNLICDQKNIDNSAFVQAVILDLDTYGLSAYTPLVTNNGSFNNITIVPITLPKKSIVGIWFGYNGDVLTLVSKIGLQNGNCINGLPKSPFGQFAACNAEQFIASARLLQFPKLGYDFLGDLCPTTWDYRIVDADPSDNLNVQYLVSNGIVVQNTAVNRMNLRIDNILANPSDERLLNAFINPAIGCKNIEIPDLTDNGAPIGALIVNEIIASQYQPDPRALIVLGNPMVQVNNKPSTTKMNLYRAQINQPPDIMPDTANFCLNYLTITPAWLLKAKGFLVGAPSPAVDDAVNLFTFLGFRFTGSFIVMQCENITGIPNPITLVGEAPVVDLIIKPYIR